MKKFSIPDRPDKYTYDGFIEHFPHSKIRKAQELALKFIDDNKHKRYIFIEMPPGGGKSAIGISTALASKHGAYYLVTTKNLQDQLTRENLDTLRVIKGRANYPCYVDILSPTAFYNKKIEDSGDDSITSNEFVYSNMEQLVADYKTEKSIGCSDCFCYDFKLKKVCMDCPYELAKLSAIMAPITCANYAWFQTLSGYSDIIPQKSIVIADECHNIIKSLVNYSEWTISNHFLAYHGINMYLAAVPSFIKNAPSNDLRIWISTHFKDALLKRIFEVGEELKEFNNEYIYLDSVAKAQKQFKLNKKYKQLKAIAEDVHNIEFNPNDWLLYTELDEDKNLRIIIKLLNIRGLFTKLIDSMALDHIIFMSATIGGPTGYELLTSELGLNIERCAYLELDSEIDVSRRYIICTESADLSYNNIKDNLGCAIQDLTKILRIHKDHMGVIHTGSYELTTIISEKLAPEFKDRLLICTTDTKESMVAKHFSDESPTILIGPSLNEGLDLKGIYGVFNVIVKCPFPDIKDPYVKIKLEDDKFWLFKEMCKILIQAYGRTNRDASDYSLTYILDSRMPRYIRNYREYLPKYFRESVAYRDSFEKFVRSSKFT